MALQKSLLFCLTRLGYSADWGLLSQRDPRLALIGFANNTKDQLMFDREEPIGEYQPVRRKDPVAQINS